MRNNAEEYAPYGFLDPNENLPFDKYLERISRPSQEIGGFVLGAVASVLNKNINLCFADCPPRCYLPMICSNADFVRLQLVNKLHYDLLGSNSGHYMALVKDPIITDAGPDVKSGHNANISSIDIPLNGDHSGKLLRPRMIECVLLNARGIVNKWRYLCAELFNSSCPLVIAVTETWLKPVHNSVRVISLDNYCCFRHDRAVKNGGESLLLVHNSLCPRPV